MKRALVVGFFDLVENALRADYGGALARRELVVLSLGRVNPKHGIDIARFRREFKQAVDDGCAEILVVLGTTEEWLIDAILAEISPFCVTAERTVDLCSCRDLRDSKSVAEHLTNAGIPPGPAPVNETAELMRKLGTDRVLCVRSSGHSSFENALTRQGFNFTSQFHEEIVPPARNSNLNQSLATKADRFEWLLYAFTGLRHLDASVKEKFEPCCINRSSPSQVVSDFKERISDRP